MKKKLKKIYFGLATPLFNRLGFVRKSTKNIVSEHSKNNLLEIFFKNLISIGFVPQHIIDIGANHGTWTRETLKYFPQAHYTLIEPQSWLQPSFQDLLDQNPNITYIPVGAGSKKGSFKFTITERDDSCTFRYTSEEAIRLGLKQVEIPITTLNDLAQLDSKPFPDLVKIDAEGIDIEVLDGANELFGKTEVFMVEAGVVMKEFENSMINIINYMDEKGYKLFDITDLNRPFSLKILWLVELVFVKKNGIIDSLKI